MYTAYSREGKHEKKIRRRRFKDSRSKRVMLSYGIGKKYLSKKLLKGLNKGKGKLWKWWNILQFTIVKKLEFFSILDPRWYSLLLHCTCKLCDIPCKLWVYLDCGVYLFGIFYFTGKAELQIEGDGNGDRERHPFHSPLEWKSFLNHSPNNLNGCTGLVGSQ